MTRHTCFTKVDAALREHNTRLAANLLNENDIFISTEFVSRSLGGRMHPKSVLAAYCPFCGKKLPKRKSVFQEQSQ